MSCQIKNGKYFAPNEEPSILHRDLVKEVGEAQANDLFVLSYTPEFKDNVINPLKNNYKNSIIKSLPTLQKEGLERKVVEKKGFRTLQLFEGKNLLGYIRLKPYRDGMQVEAVNLSVNTPKGQGFGTELYKMAIIDSLRRDIPFYSDQARTQDAQRVWNKFDFTTTDSNGRLKVSNLPQEFDENGEIKVSKVLQYAYNRNAQTAPLTFAEQQELRQMSVNIEDLEKAFYENGLFSPTKKKLEDSGIYSAYEIDRILRYVNLQASIKDKLERLKNTENLELTPIATREEFTEYDLKLNSFGKRVMNNPFVLEQEIVQEFGGLENVDLSEYDSPAIQNNAEKIQEELNQYKRLKVIDESGQEVKNKLIYRQNTYPPTKAITDRIDALLGASDNAFNSDQAQEVKKRLKKDLENIGIDLPIDTKEDLFLLEDFFLGEELETTNREKVLRVETDRNYVYLETNKSEQDLFDNLNLVATNIPNVYHKVGKITVEAMREITKDNVSDLLTMYKNYFNHPIQRPTEVKEIDVTQITEDVEYLKTDFPKDFAVEKIKNNGNEFYDSFKLTDKGIELISNDSITIEKVKAFIKDGIKLGKQIEQYSLISKSMPKLIETNNLLDLDRVNAVNNPTSISKPQAEFKVLNSELVAVKNGNQEFINVNNNVYEMDRKDGNVTYYSKLETNTDLNYLVTKVEKPTSQKYIIPDLGETDNAKIKKTKSNDNFECL